MRLFEDDETLFERIDDAIEQVTAAHEPLDNDSRCSCGAKNNMDGDVLYSHRVGVMSQAIRNVLKTAGLRQERRTNAMSSAGMTTDSKTGETTHHSDMRYDVRWVTDWQAL